MSCRGVQLCTRKHRAGGCHRCVRAGARHSGRCRWSRVVCLIYVLAGQPALVAAVLDRRHVRGDAAPAECRKAHPNNLSA